jgi:hypothetical protein
MCIFILLGSLFSLAIFVFKLPYFNEINISILDDYKDLSPLRTFMLPLEGILFLICAIGIWRMKWWGANMYFGLQIIGAILGGNLIFGILKLIWVLLVYIPFVRAYNRFKD